MKLKINWKSLGKALWAAVKPVLLGAHAQREVAEHEPLRGRHPRHRCGHQVRAGRRQQGRRREQAFAGQSRQRRDEGEVNVANVQMLPMCKCCQFQCCQCANVASSNVANPNWNWTLELDIGNTGNIRKLPLRGRRSPLTEQAASPHGASDLPSRGKRFPLAGASGKS